MSALPKHDLPDLVARHYLSAPPAITVTPPAETIQQAIDGLIEDFDLLAEWEARYQYIIDQGKKLPPLPPGTQVDEHKLQGCQSQVWLVAFMAGSRMYIRAISDATIVSGLIALLLRVYDGRPPAEISATPATFLSKLGLDAHLSPTRRNGLAAMVTAIQTIARHATAEMADKFLQLTETPEPPSQLPPVHPETYVPKNEIEAQIITALRGVFDPEIPVNIYDLGLIYAIDVSEDGEAKIRMTLTAPGCPVAGILPGQVGTAAETAQGVREATVDLVWEPAWEKDRMSEDAKLALGLF